MTAQPGLTVVVCTHNPDVGTFDRVLRALAAQTLPSDLWEIVVVDNLSRPSLRERLKLPEGLPNVRIVEETELGLTPARFAGIDAALGDVLVFVDDDNILAPDYLEQAVRLMREEPNVGAAGGVIEPEYQREPPAYASGCLELLGIRNFGPRPIRAQVYGMVGPWEPIGAGMVIRTVVARHYRSTARGALRRGLDRRGVALGSCGDTDMARCAPDLGFYLAYEPTLRMRHVIPAFRVEYGYLVRLSYSLKRSGILLDRVRTGRPEPLRSAAQKWLRLPIVCVRTVTGNPLRWGLAIAAALGELDARLVDLERA